MEDFAELAVVLLAIAVMYVLILGAAYWVAFRIIDIIEGKKQAPDIPSDPMRYFKR